MKQSSVQFNRYWGLLVPGGIEGASQGAKAGERGVITWSK